MNITKNSKTEANTAMKPFSDETDFEAFIAQNAQELEQNAVKIPGKKNQVIVGVDSPADLDILSVSKTGESTALRDIKVGGKMYRLFLVSDRILKQSK